MRKFKETKILKAYQCDRYGDMRPLILMNELQEIAGQNAEKLGFGRTFCKEHGIAWVVTHYLIDIPDIPTEGQELTISTWPAESDGVRAVRDFEIRGSDGGLKVRATSQWILMDINTRRPVRIKEKIPDWRHRNERAWDRSFDKFTDFNAVQTHVFKCRYDDIDLNQHINNAVYAVWATESVGFEYRNTHKLCGIEIHFQHEINPNTEQIEIDVNIDNLTTWHKIKIGDTVCAYMLCRWKCL